MALAKKEIKRTSIKDLEEQLAVVSERLDKLEAELTPPKGESIHHVEDYNGETASSVRPENNLKMNFRNKVASATNACKILPPNLIVNGRHLKENVTAICGFIVDKKILDAVYSDKE